MQRFRKIIPTLTLCLLGGLTALATSCTSDTEEFPGVGMATVQLRISTHEGNRITTKGYDNIDYEAGKHGEFIHSLVVLVVGRDDHLVKKKFVPYKEAGYDNGGTLALRGDIRQWMSDAFTLPIDEEYVFYALANLNNGYNGMWQRLLDELNEGDNINTALFTNPDGRIVKLDDFVLWNPAALIDVDPNADQSANPKTDIKHFIPMSTKETVRIYSNISYVDLALERLVCKARIGLGISHANYNTNIDSLVFSGCADRVGLFHDTPTPGRKDTVRAVLIKPEDRITVLSLMRDYEDEDEEKFFHNLIPRDFYVNASTEMTKPIQVSIVTNEEGRPLYKNQMKSPVDLPRNHVFPLLIDVSANVIPDLEPKVYMAPIGSALQILKIPTTTENGYTAYSFPYGCKFQLTVNSLRIGDIIISKEHFIASKWSIPSPYGPYGSWLLFYANNIEKIWNAGPNENKANFFVGPTAKGETGSYVNTSFLLKFWVQFDNPNNGTQLERTFTFLVKTDYDFINEMEETMFYPEDYIEIDLETGEPKL